MIAIGSLRMRFIGWSVFILAVLAVFAFRVVPDPRVETDILALLPQEQTDRALDTPLEEFSAMLARKQIFLVGSDSLDDAKLAAAAFAKTLETSEVFSSVQWQLDIDLAQRTAIYLSHRAFLLSPRDQQTLEAGETTPIVKRAQRVAFTPVGFMQPLGLADDPLGFTNDFLRSTADLTGNTRVDGDVLVAERDGRQFVLVITEIKGHPFATATQQRVMPAIAHARQAAKEATTARVEIVGSGSIQHASAAAERAAHEVTSFGTIESIAVVLLLLLVFGSMRPLILGLVTLALAIVAAYTAVHLVFGKVHILALVFGSSLIGSVIDYSIHFFADRFRDPAQWTPAAALPHVGPAILLGLTTTLVGYLVLAAVPFPGLEQIAPPDVMRGEETQIAGFLREYPHFAGVLCLPGTHTKWVRINAGDIVHFRTFMTGELFNLLSAHSVLRHSLSGNGSDPTEFAASVEAMAAEPAGLAARLFSIRAQSLVSEFGPAIAAARLSGLLIGAELAAARDDWCNQAPTIVGNGPQSELYAEGLRVLGQAPRIVDASHVTLAGLKSAYLQIAKDFS